MSAKSERKKQIKAEKQAAAVTTALTAPTAIQPIPKVPRQWYAEDVQDQLRVHKEHCTDPNCPDAIVLRCGEERLVAMVKNGDPKRLYIAPFGTGTPRDYQPILVLNLETGEEIAKAFNADVQVECMFSGCTHENHADQPTCFTLLCHREGIALGIQADAPGRVSVVCAEPTCNNPLKGDGISGLLMKLAPEPKAEYPNVFCKVHGIQSGDITCKHVREGVAPMIIDRPTQKDYGFALCSDECNRLLDEQVASRKPNGHFGTACAPSLNELLGGKLELYHQQAEGAAA